MKNRSLIAVLALVVSACGTSESPQSPQSLLRWPRPTTTTTTTTMPPPPLGFFRSGFESGVVLEAPVKRDGEWVQYMSGSDQGAGSSWSSDLPQRDGQRNRFSNLVNGNRSSAALYNYVDTRLVPQDGSRALRMELKAEDKSNSEATRDQFGIYPEPSMTQGYIKYRIKLQEDLASVLSPDNSKHSVILTETKHAGTPRADYRWNLFVQRDPAEPNLFWRAQAQYGDQENDPQVWECTSHVPVPLGQWAIMEVYWKLGLTDGRIWIAVNGAPIVDYTGRTMKAEKVYVWWPWKIYTGGQLGSGVFAGNTFYQYIDDVVIANGFPSIAYVANPANTCKTFAN